MNAGLPNSVYYLAGDKFKQTVSVPTWNNTFKQLSSILPFSKVIFISSKESINCFSGRLWLIKHDKTKGKCCTYVVPEKKQAFRC